MDTKTYIIWGIMLFVFLASILRLINYLYIMLNQDKLKFKVSKYNQKWQKLNKFAAGICILLPNGEKDRETEWILINYLRKKGIISYSCSLKYAEDTRNLDLNIQEKAFTKIAFTGLLVKQLSSGVTNHFTLIGKINAPENTEIITNIQTSQIEIELNKIADHMIDLALEQSQKFQDSKLPVQS